MINIGQIGIGYWGPNLLRNLVANKNCTVKMAVDISEERREFVHRLYPAISVTTEAQEIIDDNEIKAVVNGGAK